MAFTKWRDMIKGINPSRTDDPVVLRRNFQNLAFVVDAAINRLPVYDETGKLVTDVNGKPVETSTI